jgi:Asp-tRNA(Asn)/Glu-tRNA(Gln) amidotransferase A subunit family amidase
VLPETKEAMVDCVATAKAKGATITEVTLPDDFADLTHARDVISSYERARATAWEWHNHRDLLSEPLQRTIAKGFGWEYGEYQAALKLAADCRRRLADIFQGTDAMIAPLTAGEAPADLASTGDHAFVGFWNLLHVPSFALPTHTGPNDMPVGIHLVGAHGDDANLSLVAKWFFDRVTQPPHSH